jgi:hypothetical protein
MRTGTGAAWALLTTLVLVACEPSGPAPTSSSIPDPTTATGSAPTGIAGAAGACATPPGAEGAIAQVFRAASGECLAPRRLVAARCTATADPVIVLGIRREHPAVFLGGRYAVPARSVPDGAEVLGVSATERVWRTEGGDVFVEGAVATRWLRLPPRDALRGGPPDAWMIGDSILDGARDATLAALPRWNVTIDAVPGRTATGGIAPVNAAAGPVEVVTIELGTNDADPEVYRAAVESMSSTLSHVPLVMWVVPRSPKVSVDAITRTLREVVAAYPNATTADWAAAAPEDAFSDDGVHLLPDRQDAFSTFLAPRLTGWSRAVRGLGATSCVSSIAAGLVSAATG